MLLVNNDDRQRELLERCIRSLGVERVEHASDGRQAAQILLSSTIPFDLVLTEVVMPELDGIELIPIMARISPAPPVVLCSYHDWALDIGSHIAQMNGVALVCAVRKPLTREAISNVFDRFLAFGRNGPSA